MPTPDDLVPDLTEDEKLWGALVHGSVFLGFGGLGPLVIWLIYRDPDKSDYIAFRARQAAIAHGVALVGIITIGVLTCGIGTILLLPWMAWEGWMAFIAYEGRRTGYPILGDFEGRGMGTPAQLPASVEPPAQAPPESP